MAAKKEVYTSEKAYAYYKNEMYSNNQGMAGMLSYTKEIYNPVPNLVVTVKQFAKKGWRAIFPERLKNAYELIDNANDIDKLISAIIKRQVLYEELYLEVIPRPTADYINIIEKEMVLEIEKVNGEIKYAKVEGEDDAGNKITKEFFFGRFTEEVDGTIIETEKKYIIEVDKDGNEKEPIPMPEMLLIHIPSSYLINTIFNKIDRINEYEQFIYAIGKANGEPKLLMKMITRLTDEQKAELGVDKHFDETEKVIATDEVEAELKYIELSGQIIQHLQSKQTDLKDEIKRDFPELSILEAVQGSNIALNTAVVKLTVVESKIEEIRNELRKALEKCFKTIFKTDEIKLKFSDIIPKDLEKEINVYSRLYSEGVISRQTYMQQLEQLQIISSTEEEIKQISKEEKTGEGYPLQGEE